MRLAAAIRVPLATTLLLAALLVAELALLGGGGTPDKAAVPARQTAHPSSLPVADLTDQILAHPLFQPGRQASGRSAAGAAVSDTLPRLTGIVLTEGRHVAVFEPPGGPPLRLGEGDVVAGWIIRKISHRQVVVERTGGTMTIEPAKDAEGSRAAGVQPNQGGPATTPAFGSGKARRP